MTWISTAQIQSFSFSLALIIPIHWPTSILMRCQEPLDISTAQFHPFERIDPFLDIRNNGATLTQFLLSLRTDLWFRSPGQAFHLPMCMPLFRRCKRVLQWGMDDLLCLLALKHDSEKLANIFVHSVLSPSLVSSPRQTSRRSSRTFGSRKMAGCARYRAICLWVSATCSAWSCSAIRRISS